MKRHACIVLIAVALVLTASPIALGAGTRVVVMDLNVVMSESDAGRAASNELGALIAVKQAEVDEMAAAIEALSQELEEQSDSLTDEEKAAKQEELDQMIADYEQAVIAAENEVQAKAQELRDQLLYEIAQVLQIICREEGYDLVIDVSVVHYYSEIIDITSEVIRKYNSLRVQ